MRTGMCVMRLILTMSAGWGGEVWERGRTDWGVLQAEGEAALLLYTQTQICLI